MPVIGGPRVQGSTTTTSSSTASTTPEVQQHDATSTSTSTPSEQSPGARDAGFTATNVARPNNVVDIAKQLLAQLGNIVDDAGAKKLLDEVPALRSAVKLFQWVSDEGAAQCHAHCVVNTDAKLTSTKKDFGAVEKLLANYARNLGYADCLVDKATRALTLIAADGTKVPVGKADSLDGSVDELFRKLGRLINEKRLGAATGVPPTLPLDATTRAFSAENAVAACHLSMLAYESAPNIQAQLKAWGFDMSTFSFIEDKHTDTQAFVCADKQGHVHVVFRGSSSGSDVMTDLSSRFVDASWARTRGVKVHEGFSDALDAVWQQVTDGLVKARNKAGNDATVFFEGHSLGGALTQLCAARCAATGVVKSDGAICYTKGGPRVGNEAFKKLAEEQVPRTFRLVHSDPGAWGFDNDPVTGVPPRFLGYRHAGNMVKITKDDAEVIAAGTPGNRSALEARIVNMARGAGLEHTATALDQHDDASDPPDRTVEMLRGARLRAHLAGLSAAMGNGANATDASAGTRAAKAGAERAMALEGVMSESMLGVGLHFMAGYLENVGKALLRKL